MRPLTPAGSVTRLTPALTSHIALTGPRGVGVVAAAEVSRRPRCGMISTVAKPGDVGRMPATTSLRYRQGSCAPGMTEARHAALAVDRRIVRPQHIGGRGVEHLEGGGAAVGRAAPTGPPG